MVGVAESMKTPTRGLNAADFRSCNWFSLVTL